MSALTVMLPAIVAFAVVVVLTPFVKRLADRFDLVAVPKADRWHRGRIPLLGGIGVVVATLAGAAVSGPLSAPVWILAMGSTGLGIVGLVDDTRVLRPQTKLFLQIFAAGVLTALGLQFRFTGVPVLDVPITLIWIVGITNALNLLDNMDGLAAGVAAIIAAFRLAFFLADGQADAAILASAVLGACLGFLVFNFNPASIFMGDTGSLFLGFLVAGLSLVGTWPYSRSTALVLVLPVLVVLVPIFDTTFVTIARILAGRPVSQGGRDHTSHRLVALGMSERHAVLTLYGLAVIGGATAWLSYLYGISYASVLAIFLVIGTALLGIFLGRLQVYPEGQVPSGFALLMTRFTYRRQVVTVTLDTVMIVLAYYTAYLLRFEAGASSERLIFQQSLPIVLLAQVTAFMVLGTHRGIWRYTGVSDLLRLAQSCLLGTAIAALGILVIYRFEGYSRAVFVIHGVLLFLFVAATRLSFRAFDAALRRDSPEAEPVLIYGGGRGGLLVLREARDNPSLRWRVVGFLDDAAEKQGTRIEGVLVHGGLDALEQAVGRTGATRLILSTPKLAPDLVRDIVARADGLGLYVARADIRFEPLT